MKYLFSSFILFLLLFSSCSESENKSSAQLMATIDGNDYTFSLVSAKYSPVTQQADLVFQNSKVGYLDITFLGFQKLENFQEGIYSSENCRIMVVLSKPKTGTVSTSEESVTEITISESTHVDGSVTIAANADEISMYDPFLESTSIISDIQFEVKINEESTSDYISFEIGGNEYLFQTKNLSGYDYHPLFPEDMDLVLSANTSGWPLATSLQGVALELDNFVYPPTTQTMAGYENGLRLYYNFDENYCGSNFQEYGSGNNSIDDPDNTTLTITSVEKKTSSFILTGTFSGRVSSSYSFEDYLLLTNGKFRVTIPKL